MNLHLNKTLWGHQDGLADAISAWMGARLRHQFGAFAAARMVESVGGT